MYHNHMLGFPGGSVIKNQLSNAGESGSVPGLGGSPREENGNPTPVSHRQRNYSPWGCRVNRT